MRLLRLSERRHVAFAEATAAVAPGYNRAVGIFGGEKSAFLGCHVAGDVIENVARDGFILPILRDLKCVEIGDGELRLIVKHLFEMGHVPVTIDRVPVKPAAEMIVHAAGGHFAQGKQGHFECLFAGFAFRIARVKSGKKIERDRARKFRRRAEPALLRIITALNLAGRQHSKVRRVDLAFQPAARSIEIRAARQRSCRPAQRSCRDFLSKQPRFVRALS